MSTDAQCDKQATVVDLLLTTLGDGKRGHVLSTADRRPSLVYRLLYWALNFVHKAACAIVQTSLVRFIVALSYSVLYKPNQRRLSIYKPRGWKVGDGGRQRDQRPCRKKDSSVQRRRQYRRSSSAVDR